MVLFLSQWVLQETSYSLNMKLAMININCTGNVMIWRNDPFHLWEFRNSADHFISYNLSLHDFRTGYSTETSKSVQYLSRVELLTRTHTVIISSNGTWAYFLNAKLILIHYYFQQMTFIYLFLHDHQTFYRTKISDY